MKLITGISADPKQEFVMSLDDQTAVSCYLEYRPQQRGWYADFEWENWTLRGMRVVPSPNLLRQWRHIVPFGLSVLSSNDQEITSQRGFATGSAEMILLSPADVLQAEALAFARS